MDWGVKENRIAVIALYKVGMEPSHIFETLKKLEISRMFVYRTIQRYTGTSSIDDSKRSGRPRSVRTIQAVNAVRARIRRNPIRKQKILSREMKIPPRTLSRIIKEDLSLGAYRRYTGHTLNQSLKEKRVERSKCLLSRYAHEKYKNILFTDEKIFTIEQHYNKQNDKVYAHDSREAKEIVGRVQRGHHPAYVMVWWGVSYLGVSELHFCEKGVKISAKVYQDTVLETVVKPLNDTMFKNIHWTFQQDSAPGHKARTTQIWLERNVPDFIRADDWPSSSPDLNPLDYKLWSVLEDMVCSKRHANIDSLKKSLKAAVANFPMDTVRKSIDEWPDRLKACIKVKGGHFE
jgi:transposase